jgi:hypothetical protein
MTTEEKIKWLENNQPENVAEINTLRKKLVPPILPDRHVLGKPSKHWQNRGRSSN